MAGLADSPQASGLYRTSRPSGFLQPWTDPAAMGPAVRSSLALLLAALFVGVQAAPKTGSHGSDLAHVP